MTVHLILDPEGRPLGLYVDRKFILRKEGMQVDDVLTALGIKYDLLVLDDEDMKASPLLPASLDDIPIFGILGEAATVASVQAEAQARKEGGE